MENKKTYTHNWEYNDNRATCENKQKKLSCTNNNNNNNKKQMIQFTNAHTYNNTTKQNYIAI